MVPHHTGSQLLAGQCLKTSRVVSLTIEQAKDIFKTGTNLRTGQQPARMTDRRITQLLALNQRITCHKGAVPRMMLWLKSLDEDSRDEGGFVKNKRFLLKNRLQPNDTDCLTHWKCSASSCENNAALSAALCLDRPLAPPCWCHLVPS